MARFGAEAHPCRLPIVIQAQRLPWATREIAVQQARALAKVGPPQTT
jgi:hypothetical protein